MGEDLDQYSRSTVTDSVLCYVTTARNSRRNDDIVQACVSFYKKEEIVRANNLICKILGERPVRRRKEDKMVNEMQDIIDMIAKCDEDDKITLPIFLVDSFDGLPPTSGFELIGFQLVELVQELSFLKTEIQHLKEDRFNEKVYQQDSIIIKEDLLMIKGEMTKLNHKMMKDNIRRDSILLESLDDSSKKPADDYEGISDIHDIRSPIDLAEDSVFQASSDIIVMESPLPSALELTPFFSSELSQTIALSPSKASAPEISLMDENPSPKEGSSTSLFSDVLKTTIVSEEKTAKLIRKYRNGNSYPERKKTDPRDLDKDLTDKDSKRINDDVGYKDVKGKRKKRKIGIVGSKKYTENVLFKSAIKTADIYLGNCDVEVSPEAISEYLKNEMNIITIKCELLESKFTDSRSFKINLNMSDRMKLLSAEVWPQGIICRKFYTART